MYSFTIRHISVLTFAVFGFAAICFCASMTDIIHTSHPTIDIKIWQVPFRWYVVDNIASNLWARVQRWSGWLRHRFGVVKFDSLRKSHGGNDEALVLLNISADLTSLFTWNTKQLFIFVAAEYVTYKNSFNQISLWDSIIQSKEESKFQLLTYNKYDLIDRGNDLSNRNFNLTMHWHAMPKAGLMFQGSSSSTGFLFPSGYF